jgi:hypothetical protein
VAIKKSRRVGKSLKLKGRSPLCLFITTALLFAKLAVGSSAFVKRVNILK